MGDLTWGGKLAVDHDDAFVHLEVPGEDGVSVVTLDPDVVRRLGRGLVVHAEALLPQEVTVADPCTPSTEHVRAVYSAQHGAILAEEHGREFDRWLAEHDTAVRADVIAAAPHGLDCFGVGVIFPDQETLDRMCTCWKHDALAAERST